VVVKLARCDFEGAGGNFHERLGANRHGHAPDKILDLLTLFSDLVLVGISEADQLVSFTFLVVSKVSLALSTSGINIFVLLLKQSEELFAHLEPQGLLLQQFA